MSKKVMIRNVRLSYEHIYQPSAMDDNSTPKYSAEILIPKDHPDLPALKRALLEAGAEKFPQAIAPGKPWPMGFTSALKDADKDTDGNGVIIAEKNPESKGCYILKTQSTRRPQTVGRRKEQLTEEDGSHPGMHYVREKVRLIVVPVVNVYSAATNHERRNSANVDLNRDWLAHSQAETINVLRQIHLYKDELAAIIDFHGCRPTTAPLYYQFSMQSTNSNVCRKVANHIQQRLVDMGREKGEPILSNIPGKYNKSNLFLQGYCYNTFNIPTLVAEHNPGRWYEEHSADSLQWATECYGNIIIQHALAKLKTK